MRAMTAMAVMASVVMASVSFADVNVDIGIRNNNTNNANATATANQTQTQSQNQSQSINNSGNATLITNERTQLTTVGFNPLATAGIAMRGDEWRVICPAAYNPWAVDDFMEAKSSFGFIDFITFSWGTDYEFTKTGKRLPANNDPVYCVNYWPKDQWQEGDKWMGSVKIKGQEDMTDDAYIAKAYAVCKEETGSRRIAVRIREKIKTITKSASLNTSGGASVTSSNGQGGATVSSGIGFGKATVEAEEYAKVEALCLNDAGQVIVERKPIPEPPAPPVVSKPEPRRPVVERRQIARVPRVTPEPCDEVCSDEKIARLSDEIKNCQRWSMNNMRKRVERADCYIDKFTRTGNRDYLKLAIRDFEMAEGNYYQGWDISKYQSEADVLLARAYYLQSGCELEVKGRKAAMKFKADKKLEQNPPRFVR